MEHMAATTPTTEPTKLRAGDTARWDRSLADYPASTWTLTYRLVSDARTYTFNATANADTHEITVAMATTAAWLPGIYQWTSTVTDGTSRYTVATGHIEVLYNPGTVSAPMDTRTHAKTVLDAIEAVLEGRATHDVASYTIGGRQLARMPIEDLLTWRGQYRAEVRAEEDKARVALGRPSKRHIGVKFGSI